MTSIPPLVGVISVLFLYGESGVISRGIQMAFGLAKPWPNLHGLSAMRPLPCRLHDGPLAGGCEDNAFFFAAGPLALAFFVAFAGASMFRRHVWPRMREREPAP